MQIDRGQGMENKVFRHHFRFLQVTLLAGVVVLISISTGCFFFDNGDFDNIDFIGYIRWSTDSTGVPNAAIHIENVTDYDDKSESRDYHADENGYFNCRITIPANALSSQVPEREWLFTAYDDDGLQHGTFVLNDTLLIEYDPQHNFETQFLFDLYVDQLVTQPLE